MVLLKRGKNISQMSKLQIGSFSFRAMGRWAAVDSDRTKIIALSRIK